MKARKGLFRVRPTEQETPSIAEFAFTNVWFCLLYTLLTISVIEHADGVIGKAMGLWVEFTSTAVDALWFFHLKTSSSADLQQADRIAGYRHIVTACSILTICSVYLSKKYWRHWGNELEAKLAASSSTASGINRVLIVAHRKITLGIVAIALLLVFGDSWGDGRATFSYNSNWWLLRAPALTGLAGGFACYDAVFRLCLRNRSRRVALRRPRSSSEVS